MKKVEKKAVKKQKKTREQKRKILKDKKSKETKEEIIVEKMLPKQYLLRSRGGSKKL
jgi:hypothetical protein